MNDNYLQLGAVFAIAMALIEIIKVLIGYIFNKNGNGLLSSVNQISTNDLVHIHQELEKHTTQHERMLEVLVEIKTILRK